jgi:ribose transport system substrate-binding protein
MLLSGFPFSRFLACALALAGLFGAPSAMADAGLDRANAVVDSYRALPQFHAPGPAFDARACAAGKKMLAIPNNSGNQFLKGLIRQEIAAGAEVGLAVTEWENQGQPNQWVQGMNFAIQSHDDIIDLAPGLEPKLLDAQIRAASEAGIKTMVSHFYDSSQTPAPGLIAVLPVDFNKIGRIMADWAIVRTGGKANVIIVEDDEILPTAPLVAGVTEELAANCPACKVTQQINVGLTEWSTRIQPAVQAALIANPTANFVIPIYDSMSQFIVPAIRLTGKSATVRIVTSDGTPFVLDYVQQGAVDMDLGKGLDWAARATIDAYLRTLCGVPMPNPVSAPFYIFDAHNAKDAGSPASFLKGYGDDYVAGFDRLWGLK